MSDIITPVIVKPKKIVSYYKSGDPTRDFSWVSKLTDINVIRTKRITDEFIDVCIKNKHRIYLHIEISGMGQTMFEPNIPSVKQIRDQIIKLIKLGFPQTQILIIVSPILQNDNGLNALKLLMRIFTEFKPLYVRRMRFKLIQYREIDDKPGKFTLSNNNILKRQSTKSIARYLFKNPSFFKDYYNLVNSYRGICSIDTGEEQLIGIRELMAFGLKNKNDDGTPIIEYMEGKRNKPIVNIISSKNPVRCTNRCLLCPYKF